MPPRLGLAIIVVALVAARANGLACVGPDGPQIFASSEAIVVARVESIRLSLPARALRLFGSLLPSGSLDNTGWSYIAIARLRVERTLKGRTPATIDVESDYSPFSECSAPFYYPGELVLAFLHREGPRGFRDWVTTGAGDGSLWIRDPTTIEALAVAVQEGSAAAEAAASDPVRWQEWALDTAVAPTTRGLGLKHLRYLRTNEEASVFARAFVDAPTVQDAGEALWLLRNFDDPKVDQLAVDLTAAWLAPEDADPRESIVSHTIERLDGWRPGFPDYADLEKARRQVMDRIDASGLVARPTRFLAPVREFQRTQAQALSRLRAAFGM